MQRSLSLEALQPLVEADNIAEAAFDDLVDWFRGDAGIGKFVPDGLCQVDPRNNERILFNRARAKRPHDNRPAELAATPSEARPCVICEGKTTRIVDVAPLSEGCTFINKNLFPMVYPAPVDEQGPSGGIELDPQPIAKAARGFHFLQWTSSLHDKDWHNMPDADRQIVVRRLAALEERLLTQSAALMPSNGSWGDASGRCGFVCIAKNYGRLVGGSLEHGHQQIVLSNIAPRRFRDNLRFFHDRDETFSAFLQRENPPELLLRDYGSAILLVPYFMKRPAEMMLLIKDTSRRYLHELNSEEIQAVGHGWRDAIVAIRGAMQAWDRELAYNVITHNGPGAGLYFEFLPYTQETGSYEHLGLFVCQGTPETSHAQLIKTLV